jgi:hypothetical protein
VDDVVRKAYTDLTLAIVEQSFRYARSDIACPSTEGLETNGCEKCCERENCVIKRNASSLIIEARKWVVGDGVEFMENMGCEYDGDDIRRLL